MKTFILYMIGSFCFFYFGFSIITGDIVYAILAIFLIENLAGKLDT